MVVIFFCGEEETGQNISPWEKLKLTTLLRYFWFKKVIYLLQEISGFLFVFVFIVFNLENES